MTALAIAVKYWQHIAAGGVVLAVVGFGWSWQGRGRRVAELQAEVKQAAIRAEAIRQEKEIVSKAYMEAERTRGEGDAKAMRVYRQAYGKDPGFYKLTRTLESYKKILDG
ncbi:MAG: hypothetical protein GY844_14775, partial [Bradyrhizobium sp.]|nr:hypothetical protein [Bradyrhizobium sp.]